MATEDPRRRRRRNLFQPLGNANSMRSGPMNRSPTRPPAGLAPRWSRADNLENDRNVFSAVSKSATVSGTARCPPADAHVEAWLGLRGDLRPGLHFVLRLVHFFYEDFIHTDSVLRSIGFHYIAVPRRKQVGTAQNYLWSHIAPTHCRRSAKVFVAGRARCLLVAVECFGLCDLCFSKPRVIYFSSSLSKRGAVHMAVCHTGGLDSPSSQETMSC